MCGGGGGGKLKREVSFSAPSVTEQTVQVPFLVHFSFLVATDLTIFAIRCNKHKNVAYLIEVFYEEEV